MRIAVSSRSRWRWSAPAGAAVAVSADGTLLRDVASRGSLPTITLPVAPGGTPCQRRRRWPRSACWPPRPYQLLARVDPGLQRQPLHGLVAQLRNGPKLYFGAGDQLGAKWAAAAAVLADPSSAGATTSTSPYPSRPAAGAGSDAAGSAHAASGQTSTSGTASSAGAASVHGGSPTGG